MPRWPTFLRTAVVALTLTACSGGGDSGTTQPPVSQSIALQLSATSGTVARGASGNATISLSRVGGYTGTLALSAENLPAGVTAAFTPEQLTGSASSATVVFTVGATAVAGTSSITVRAAGSGVTAATATYALTIPAPAVALTAGTGASSIVIGGSATVPITITRSNGFTDAVTLTATGLPTGVTAAFTPTTIASGSTTSTLTLTVAGTATPGASTVTISASGTGVTTQTASLALTLTAAATPAVAVTATPAAVSIVAGATGTTAIAVSRTGGFAGDVTLALEGAPAGVTGAFSANPVSAAGTASTLTISSTGAAAPGIYNLTVRATGTGVTAATTTVAVTVTAAPTYTMSATAVSVPQSVTGTSTVTIARNAGFTGTVSLTITGLPVGVSASFNPTTATGNTSLLTLSVGGSVPAGSYTGTITGTSAGLANVTTTVALTVTAAGGGTGNVNWTFCETERFPLWFAFQNGTSGVWTRVTSTGTTTRVYSFTVNTAGGVAYAIPRSGGGTDVTVQYLTQAELTAGASNECLTNRPTKSLTGTVAGLATAGQSANIGIGGAVTTVSFPVTSYTLTGVDDGTTDLLAFRRGLNLMTFMQDPPDRGVLRRNVNYPAGGAIPVIDFTGGESFAVASAQYTVANAASDNVFLTSAFLTSNGTAGSFALGALTGTGTGPYAVYGVPTANTQSGDLHQVLATAYTGSGTLTSTRSVLQYNRILTNRTITLGPVMSPPTVTSLGAAPYVRFSATGSWQAEYADAVGIGYTQTTTNSNSWSLSMSRNYSGTSASSWTLAVPDFSGVAGFNNAWAMASATTTWAASTTGFISGVTGTTVIEDTAFRFGARTNTIAP